MIKQIAILTVIVLCGLSACKRDDSEMGYSLQDTTKTYGINSAKAVDMVLIYKGGVHRPEWTSQEFAPYVSYVDPETNKESWLFDGFLFLEFADGAGRSFVAPVNASDDSKASRKQEWEMVLANQFESGEGIDALNKQIAAKVGDLGAPKRKRKVVIGLSEPRPGQLDWGALNGVQLNFSSQSDRMLAVRWYIDEILRKWQQLNPAHLELAGFYWVAESAYISQVMLPSIKSYIVTKGNYFFYHIPHWGAMLRVGWEKLGFDISYQQPNVYFHSTRIISVKEALDFAKQNGHSLEFEFDENAMVNKNNPDKRGRFLEYFNEFESNDIFDTYPLTYYQSHFAWSQLVNSTHQQDVELSSKLARKIIERQAKADEAN